ncbi:hypothetical protein J6590_033772 [Homalodisca vitripennis]|nr:hypothetical protein J6590_033772 [Homalodisca vitripennis]
MKDSFKERGNLAMYHATTMAPKRALMTTTKAWLSGNDNEGLNLGNIFLSRTPFTICILTVY